MISWEIDKQLLYETEQDIQQKVSVCLSLSLSKCVQKDHTYCLTLPSSGKTWELQPFGF